MDVHPPKNGIFIGIDPYPQNCGIDPVTNTIRYGDLLHKEYHPLGWGMAICLQNGDQLPSSLKETPGTIEDESPSPWQWDDAVPTGIIHRDFPL